MGNVSTGTAKNGEKKRKTRGYTVNKTVQVSVRTHSRYCNERVRKHHRVPLRSSVAATGPQRKKPHRVALFVAFVLLCVLVSRRWLKNNEIRKRALIVRERKRESALTEKRTRVDTEESVAVQSVCWGGSRGFPAVSFQQRVGTKQLPLGRYKLHAIPQLLPQDKKNTN